jgi:hypothetical protein
MLQSDALGAIAQYLLLFQRLSKLILLTFTKINFMRKMSKISTSGLIKDQLKSKTKILPNRLRIGRIFLTIFSPLIHSISYPRSKIKYLKLPKFDFISYTSKQMFLSFYNISVISLVAFSKQHTHIKLSNILFPRNPDKLEAIANSFDDRS